MSIQDFYLEITRRSASSTLFNALRRLRQIEDIHGLLAREETSSGGWNPWMDGNEHHQNAVADA